MLVVSQDDDDGPWRLQLSGKTKRIRSSLTSLSATTLASTWWTTETAASRSPSTQNLVLNDFSILFQLYADLHLGWKEDDDDECYTGTTKNERKQFTRVVFKMFHFSARYFLQNIYFVLLE